jgi:hypothetical protein
MVDYLVDNIIGYNHLKGITIANQVKKSTPWVAYPRVFELELICKKSQ